MKYLLFSLILFVAPAIARGADTKPGNPGLDAIIKALSAGDAAALSKFFADQVEVSIGDKEQSCTKVQATEIMQGFFDANKPKTFTQVHTGTSRENSDQYCIGNLELNGGGEYRVYLFLKANGTNLQIKEIRLDRA
jgi:Domain of unknown function (DUF4783)